MKTLKKLFSVSAIVALLGTLVPMYAFAANYSDELQEAYAYAYTNGITTMKSIDAADMYGSLTRVAMAKMIANYATTVLGLTPDTSAKCTFTDVTAALDAQYDNGVTKACQLGLMGQNITAFRPNDLVTRAEFGTTLSRALNANSDDLAAMNAADPYYKDHLNFLKAEGIMNQIDNPSMTEVRGYVMLMMMRADEGYTPNEKCSLEEMVACALADDTDACLAACTGNEGEEEPANPGYATVSAKAASAQTVALNAVDKKIGTITLKAGDNDTTVTAVEITKAGLGNANDIATISLMKNGQYVTNAATLNSNNVAKLRFRPNLTLKAKGSETFDVVVSMGGGTAGGTHDFSVTALTVSNGSFGGTPAKLGSLTTTNYLVASLTGTISNESADAGDENTEIATITLRPGADATVDSITLSSENNNDSLLNVIANAKAYIDDEVIGTVTVNEETIVIAGLNKSIAKGKSVDVVLKADVIFAGADGTSFDFTIEENRIVATENSTNERMHVAEDTGTFTITNGVGLTLKNNVKKTQKVVIDTEDVVLMDIDVESSANIEVLDYTLVFKNTAYAALTDLEDIRVSVDGDEFDLPESLFDTDANDAIDNRTINLADKQLNAFSIDAGKKVNVKVLATVKTNTTVNHQVTLYIHRIKNTDTNNFIGAKFTAITTKIASEAGHETSVTDGSLTVTKKSTDGSTLKIGETADVLSFTVKAKSEDATLKTLVINTPYDATLANVQNLKNNVIDEITLKGTSKKLDADDLVLTILCDDDTIEEYSTAPVCTPSKYFLSGAFTSLATVLKEDVAAEFTVQLKVDSDLDVTNLGKDVSLNVPVNGLIAKGKTSDNTVTNGTAVEGKVYQIATTRPTVEVENNGKFILVTINNDSDYRTQINGISLEVLSARDNNNNQLLPSNTPRQVREDSTDGTLLTATEITATGKTPGTPSWTFTAGNEPTISEGESKVFVIEMVSEVAISSTDYTATGKTLTFQYWNDDVNPAVLVTPAITETY